MKKTLNHIMALAVLIAVPFAAVTERVSGMLDTARGFLWSRAVGTGMVLGANVLDNLAADIYRAADIVGRELVGILPSITLNGGSEAAALGDTVRSHFTRVPTVGTLTPSMTIPEGNDQTVDTKTLVLNQTAGIPIPWTGEDMKHVNNGAGFETIYGDQIAQAFRAISNQIEAYAWGVARKAASRAYGTSGTTPFASNFNEVAEMRQILVDNGMPIDGQSTIVLNSTAGTKLRNLAQLQKANEAGGTNLLRQGTLLDLQGLMLKESAGVGVVTKGTASGATTNNAGYSVGTTTITLAAAGTGTILAGDVITFAGDSNQYVVVSGDSDVSNGGTITIGAPGLRQAIAASATNITVTNSFTANLALHKGAIEIAVRPMADPAGGDAAVDKMVVQDPWSGLVFEIAAYKGFKKAMFMVSCVYGGKGWKEEHVALLKG